MQSVPAASTASTTVSRLCRQRWPTGCSTAPQIVCSLIGSCESKVGRSIRSPMRQSDTLRCDPMQRSSWPHPPPTCRHRLAPEHQVLRAQLSRCRRYLRRQLLGTLVDTGSEYSFLVSADNWARWQCARFMHCAAAIEQVRRTFRALPLCAWLHVETDNGPRSLRVSGIPMRGISTRDCATYWG